MMDKDSFAASTMVFALLVAGFAFLAFPPSAATAATASCTADTSPFTVTGATWGTVGSPESAYPGDQNVPLTVTLLFAGPCDSPQTIFQLNLSSTGVFTGPDGTTRPEVISPSTIGANSLATETFYLNISPGAPTSPTGVTYDIPMTIQYSNDNATNQITQVVTVPVALRSPAALSFSSSATHLVAGADNNVTFSVSNTGAGDATDVSIAVSVPSSVTVLNQVPSIQSLDAGSNSTGTVELFVPSSLTGQAVTLAFTAKYLDAYENSLSFSQNLIFTAGNSVSTSSPFATVSASWGSAGASPLPGTQDVTLLVALQYLGLQPVTSLEGAVQLPAGLTDLNGRDTATAVSAATTNQYGLVQLTFYIDIGNQVRAGSYNYTLSLTWMTSTSTGMTQTSVLTPPPIGQLQSSFQVEGATWGKALNSNSSSAVSPVPGSSDIPLVVSLLYLGTTPVTSVEGTLSLPDGFTDLNGHSASTAFAVGASGGQVVSLTFNLDVSSAVAPGSYNFTLALSWTTSNSVALSQTAVVSPAPVVSATTSSFPLSVTQANSTLTAGSQTATSFTLTNDGTATIYSPTFSLTVASPVVLASIGSPLPAAEVGPGSNATFTAHLTSGPSATSGIYSGTLTVIFTDASGTSHSQTFPVSFTLEGTIILILQNTAVSQTATGFTVTGTILDEGSASAYYASISGLLGINSATPVYLGEIDPNTPLPFSVTIPFAAPATVTTSATSRIASSTNSTVSGNSSRVFNSNRTLPGNFSLPGGFGGFNGFGNRTSAGAGQSVDIAISLSFKDTFGTSKVKAFTVPTAVKTASQLSNGVGATVSSSSSSNAELKDIAYGVVGVVVATLVIGGFMARRYRSRRLASLPPEQRGEQSVI